MCTFWGWEEMDSDTLLTWDGTGRPVWQCPILCKFWPLQSQWDFSVLCHLSQWHRSKLDCIRMRLRLAQALHLGPTFRSLPVHPRNARCSTAPHQGLLPLPHHSPRFPGQPDNSSWGSYLCREASACPCISLTTDAMMMGLGWWARSALSLMLTTNSTYWRYFWPQHTFGPWHQQS